MRSTAPHTLQFDLVKVDDRNFGVDPMGFPAEGERRIYRRRN